MDKVDARNRPHARSHRLSRPIWPKAVLALILIGSASYVGCSSDTRYQILTFFFDGVPQPGEEQKSRKVRGPWGISLDPDDPMAREFSRPTRQGPVEAKVVFFQHKPFRDRKCFSCHTPEASLVAPPVTAGLCRKCHEPYVDFSPTDWVHGPVAKGECKFCHEAHKSEFPGLLKTEQSELCLGCHVDPDLLDRSYHRLAVDRDCSFCHDPHMAGNRLLLVDSGSYRRRKKPQMPGSVHAVWKDRQCAICHLPEQAKALAPDVDEKCLECHEEVLEKRGERPLHKAIQERKCLPCHSAHKSPLPYLLRQTAEQMCYACHKVEETRKPPHPPVERADCLLCHTGHSSARDHLLNEDALDPGEGVEDEPAGPGPTGPPAPGAENIAVTKRPEP